MGSQVRTLPARHTGNGHQAGTRPWWPETTERDTVSCLGHVASLRDTIQQAGITTEIASTSASIAEDTIHRSAIRHGSSTHVHTYSKLECANAATTSASRSFGVASLEHNRLLDSQVHAPLGHLIAVKTGDIDALVHA